MRLFVSASFLAISAAAGQIAFTLPAHAQGNAAGRDEAGSTGLEEIIVTARRREEKLQSVPLAVTAFSGRQIVEKGVQTAEDLQHLVPSLIVNNTNIYRDEQTFTLRGQGATLGTSPGVVAYFAEVPSITNGAGPGFYYDLDSVQVLKGPQGTLFGKNTTGGAVLFEPKKPVDNFEGYGQVTLGDYNWHEFEGAVNVPIIPGRVLARISGDFKQRDGFTTDYGPFFQGRDYDNVDFWAGRAELTIRPSDDFENYIVASSYYSHTNGGGSSLLKVNPNFSFGALNLGPLGTFPITLGGNGPTPISLATNFSAALAAAKAAGRFSAYPNLGAVFAAAQAAGPRGTALSTDQISKQWDYGVTDIAKWDVSDNLTIKNIASYQEHKLLQRWDLDGGALPFVDVNTPHDWSYDLSQATEELQFQGKALDGHLSVVAGGFLEYLHPIGDQPTQAIQLGGFNPANPTLTPHHEDSQRSQAVYAQGVYDFSQISSSLEGLKLTAGYRYTWDWRTEYNFQYTPDGRCSQKPGFKFPDCTLSVDGDFHAGTWLLGLDYQITPNTLVYVSSRRGYKSGGFNENSGNAATLAYKPEYLTDVELGIKSDWELFGAKLRTNLDAFHGDYTNIQTSVAVFSNGQAANIIENGAAATIEGFEVEATAVPVKGLLLGLGYSYLHAKYDQVAAGTTTVAIGSPFTDTPLNKITLNAQYQLPFLQSIGDLSVSATYSYQTHIQIDPAASGFDTMGAYSVLNLRADMRQIGGEPLDVSLFATNVTDTVYRVGQIDLYSSLGYVSALYNEPRMFGVQIRYAFGGAPEEEAAATSYTPPPAVALGRQVPQSYLVFFDFNKSDLTSQATQIVDQAASNAGPAKVTRLTVTGHTDTVGSDAYNMRLSRRRAESVASRLEKDGIPSSEIEILAKGKRDLLVPTADGVKEPQNRRVQIVYDGEHSS